MFTSNKSIKRIVEMSTTPISLSNSKICIKVYRFSEPAMWWTVPLENHFTVAHVCESICHKLGGESIVGYVLIRRTKRTLGRSPKDVILPMDAKISDIDYSQRKRKKEYTLLIQALDNSNSVPTSTSHVLGVSPDTSSSLLSSTATSADFSSTNSSVSEYGETGKISDGPRLRSSSSTPIPSFSPAASSPVFLLESPSPDRNEQVKLLFGNSEFIEQVQQDDQENGVPNDIVIHEVSSPTATRRRSTPEQRSTPPRITSDSVTVEAMSNSALPKSPMLETRDIPPSTRPMSVPASNSKGKGTHYEEQPSPFARRPKRGSAIQKRSSNPFQKEKDDNTLKIVRVYPSDDGNIGGRCWTIAITPLHTAREVCLCIETRLSLGAQTLTLFMLYEKPGGGRAERALGDEDRVLQTKSWLTGGQLPFFFLRETCSRKSVKDLPRPVPAPRQLIPPGFKRTGSTEITPRSPFNSPPGEKRNSLPIFLAETYNSSSSEDTETLDDDMEEPVDITALKSDQWSIEPVVKPEQSSHVAHVNWINSHDIEKLEKIGEGSYAKVYKGMYNGSKVAIKTLKGVASEEQLASFRKEFEVLSVTSSPYLIRFHGAVIGGSATAMSMVFSFCDCGSLHHALTNKKINFDWQTLFKWTHQALNGVNYLHSMSPPLVHRDLKSQNLLLDSKWNIKVADFGLARTLTMSHASSLGNLRGTMAYCAPEIYDGQIYNGKSDVYSMAIVIWEMVTRCIGGIYRGPYLEYPEIQHPFQLIIKTSKNKLRPTIHPKTPVEMTELIQRCWDADPDVRPTCAELITLIQNMYLRYKENATAWESLREKPGENSS